MEQHWAIQSAEAATDTNYPEDSFSDRNNVYIIWTDDATGKET